MAKWLDGLEKAIGGGSGGPTRIRAMRWLLLIGGIGVAIMIVNAYMSFDRVAPTTNQSEPPVSDVPAMSAHSSDSPFASIEQPLENRLKEILEKIVGVGPVDVLVSVESTEETVFVSNEQKSQQTTEETDKNGGRRHMTSVTDNGTIVMYEQSGDQTPIITKKIKPRISGVLIVAKGAENPTVKRLILDAVEKGINVPVNRISIVPRKQQ
ncbi:stage III sporulation protein AG [Paenibacillus cellulosilyticus]|uniref:Stage III sporulation protein AG n=1 Tax=Paenibacillus cellulosilyticus TaxID=375489 RepID=A0A2V2Z0D3_9BACL|nr:stage III sporulation protein AG [Paenibacillus cellulosilyticus]PWW05658.1 stage III sporulation protein AG [Paenibacillus cellulosilyticus]QKS45317.1 stage III sporulation protein AG [Paenibacillus cellulosilyticus]